MALKGSRELRARLKAIKTVFKPVGKKWGRDTVRLAQSRVPVRTGRTKRSIRVKNASLRKAAVQATWGARFIEKDTKPHDIRVRKFKAMKFNVAGQPRFSKRVHHAGSKGRPFLRNSARDALERNPMLAELIKLWNDAA